ARRPPRPPLAPGWQSHPPLALLQSGAAPPRPARSGVAKPGCARLLQPIPWRADDAAVHPAVAALSLEEKGLVLGAALARTAPAALEARVPGATGVRCAAALAALSDETRPARAAALAALTALVREPVPAGIEHIHPDWLRERLERE